MLDYRIAAVCGAALGAALAARSKYERKSLICGGNRGVFGSSYQRLDLCISFRSP